MQELQYANWPDDIIYQSVTIRELIIDRSIELQIPIAHLALFLGINEFDLVKYLESDNYMEEKRKIKVWRIIRILELLGVRPIIKCEINPKYDPHEVRTAVTNSFKQKMASIRANRRK